MSFDDDFKRARNWSIGFIAFIVIANILWWAFVVYVILRLLNILEG